MAWNIELCWKLRGRGNGSAAEAATAMFGAYVMVFCGCSVQSKAAVAAMASRGLAVRKWPIRHDEIYTKIA